MIRAHKIPLFEGVFDMYCTRLIRRHFHRLLVRGVEELEKIDRGHPVIVYANHSSWWDAILPYYLSHRLFRMDAFAMMEERQLERYRFFRWLGVFSVDRDHPRSAMESIRYAGGLFDRPNRAVWVFPQGVLLPNDVRPIACAPGFVRIARDRPGVQFVPLAFRYEFLMEQRPECFVSIGEPVTAGKIGEEKHLVALLAGRLTGLLDVLREDVTAGRTDDFAVALSGKPSISTALKGTRSPGGLP